MIASSLPKDALDCACRTQRSFGRFVVRLAPMPFLAMLAGCNLVVMAPAGDIAAQQRDLIVISTVLMLLIIVPVIILTLFFAFRFRSTNTAAPYEPEWHHSTRLEVVIWSAPLAIIIVLGTITWISTHKLDPYRPLDRIDAERAVTPDVKPLTVEVVAMDWKWLFLYPDQGIATVNELAAPIDVPINFKITASTVMNSFYIPALAGQIYAMAGMETKMHAVMNHVGIYDGFSANYSGPGFSQMRFKFHGMAKEDFARWVEKVRTDGGELTRPTYRDLELPSQKEPVKYYARVANGLYDAILNMCTDPSKMCLNEMYDLDARGGGGMESINNVFRLTYDRERQWGANGRSSLPFVVARCTPTGAGPGGSEVLPPANNVSF